MSTDLTLYEVADEYRDLVRQLADTDLDDQTIADTLEGERHAIERKGAAVGAVVLNLAAQAEMVSAAAKKLQDRAKRLQSRSDWLIDYLHSNMVACNISEIEPDDKTWVAKVRQNPPKVELIPEVEADPGTMLPPRFLRVETRVTPDRKALMDALKAGEEINGAYLTRSTRLEIK